MICILVVAFVTVPVRATSHYTKRATPTKISTRKNEAVEPHEKLYYREIF
jgi:hypothetical protein